MSESQIKFVFHLKKKALNPYSAGNNFSRQNLTSVDIRF